MAKKSSIEKNNRRRKMAKSLAGRRARLKEIVMDKDKPVEYAEIKSWLAHRCGDALDLTGLEQAPRESLFSWIMERVEKLHDVRGEQYGEDWEKIERFLIIETIEHWLKMQQRLMLEIVREPLPVRERLERLLEAVLPSRDAVRSELSFQTEVWSFAKDHPEALQALHQAYLGFRHACSDMIEVGRDEGYVTAADASWIYLLMHALIDGIAFQLVLDPDLDLAELRQRLLQLIDRLVTA